MKTVYLAGPINGCSDDEAWGWRVGAKRLLSDFNVLDPMRRDYRGKEAESVDAIVKGDLDDIHASDIILVMAKRASWGTAMELVYAHQWCKTIIAVCPVNPSPWLAFHATEILPTLETACARINAAPVTIRERPQVTPKDSAA